jgi:hypothetical protein
MKLIEAWMVEIRSRFQIVSRRQREKFRLTLLADFRDGLRQAPARPFRLQERQPLLTLPAAQTLTVYAAASLTQAFRDGRV